MGINEFIGYVDYEVEGGSVIIFPLYMGSVILCVLMVAKRIFLDMSLLPLMFVPIMPFIGSEGLYANSMSPLHIPILWNSPLNGGIILVDSYLVLSRILVKS